MKIRKLLSVLLLAFLFNNVNAQVSASYYSSVNFSKIGIGYKFSDRFWSDLRMYGGLSIQDFTIEPTLAYNYVTKENYDLYFGAGFSINCLTGPIFPVGLSIKPLENKNVVIHIEAEPKYYSESEELLFYCSIGLRYIFKAKDN